jgi:hypothetical protein
VANVEVSSDVGRGEGHREGALGERSSVLVELGLEVALLLPPVVVSGLDLGRVVARGEVARNVLLSAPNS